MVDYIVKYLVLIVVKDITGYKKHFFNALNIMKPDKEYLEYNKI